MSCEPVATTRSAACISACVMSLEAGGGRICTRSSGAPTFFSSARIRSTARMVVFSPAGEAAMMMALRPLIAIIALLTGVAPGLVDGVMAATRPTGLAYLTRPRFLSSSMMPTDFTRSRSRRVPKVLRCFLMILSGTLPSLVSATASCGQFLGMRGIVDRPRERGDRLVGLRLVGIGEGRQGRAAAPHQVVNDRLGVCIHRRFHCHSHRQTTACCARMSSRLMPATTTGFFMASRRNGSPSS